MTAVGYGHNGQLIVGNGFVNTVSITMDRAATVGELIVVSLSIDKNAGGGFACSTTGTAPILRTSHSGASVSGAIFTKVAEGGEQTFDITWTTGVQGVRAEARTYPSGYDFVSAVSGINGTEASPTNNIPLPAIGAGASAGMIYTSYSQDTANTMSESNPPTASGCTILRVKPGAGDSQNPGYATAERTIAANETATITWTTPEIDQAWAGAVSLASSGGGGGDPTPTGVETTASWIGSVSDTSAKVYVRNSGATSVAMEWSTTSDFLTSTVTAGIAPDTRGWTRHTLTGLPSNMLIYWRPVTDGTASNGGKLKTHPTPMTPANYSFGFASCWDHNVGLDPVVFERITTKAPLWFEQLGDLNYLDVNSTDPTLYHNAFDTTWADSPRWKTMTANVEVPHMTSDHDFAGNASHAGSTGAATSTSVFRDRVPVTPVSATGLWHSRIVGRVLHIYLDTRSQRSNPADADTASKVMLGAEQEQWLKDQITNTEAPMIFVRSDVPWPPGGAQDDHWGDYQVEQQRLLTWIAANRGTKKIHFITGDSHHIGIDDGDTWIESSIGYSGEGVGTWNASPIVNTNSTKGAPWSGGTFTPSQNQYGWVDIQDDGTTITATFNGFRADTDVSVATNSISVAVASSTPRNVRINGVARTIAHARLNGVNRTISKFRLNGIDR